MDGALSILVSSAVGVAWLHALIGVDHTVPFVVLGRAQGWSLRRLWSVTALCGAAHVLSSVLLGVLGIQLGARLVDLTSLEADRGELAAWLLVGFGLTYAGWSIGRRRRRQRSLHRHADGTVHAHTDGGPGHRHAPGPASEPERVVGAWTLFVIFVLGPCEPLIPLMMVPALDVGPLGVVAVAAAFGLTTVATMLVMVTVGWLGMKLPALRRLEPHAHTFAGLAIATSGLAITLFGI